MVAHDDTASTRPGRVVVISVVANDEGPIDRTTLEIVSGPTQGGSAQAGSSGNVRYRAPEGWFGVDTFTYRICDSTRTYCDTAVVRVEVG
ncbi:MAG: hypothetical protein KatS3mg011_1264 [Acidimicrobiia bacterium]|nr:MAG: hypothetical protein KatS3mg011_1264 [Acidimicrobiia bacterium]